MGLLSRNETADEAVDALHEAARAIGHAITVSMVQALQAHSGNGINQGIIQQAWDKVADALQEEGL